MRLAALGLIVAGISELLPASPAFENGVLKIVATGGDSAFNSIKQRTARNPMVEVRDENDSPVAGAEVVFTLPFDGPSGTFANGSRKYVTKTDAKGRAATIGLKPNTVEGRFTIKVTASFEGKQATASISQTNTLAGGTMVVKKNGNGKKVAIVALLGGAVAGGILAGTRGGKSNTASGAGVPATSLTIGGITVGGPR